MITAHVIVGKNIKNVIWIKTKFPKKHWIFSKKLKRKRRNYKVEVSI